MKKVCMISLGCPKNLTDSEELLGSLCSSGGCQIIQDENKADIAILNTCAFIAPAVKEAVSEIKKLINLKKTGRLKKIIVCGCLVEREKEKLKKKFPQIDSIVSTRSLDKINLAIEKNGSYLENSGNRLISPDYKLRLTVKHSAYLKIADGCDNLCSYCLIPALKGRFRSKSMEMVINETKALIKTGAKEISLIAQDSTNYGIDLYGKPVLTELLKKLIKIPKLKWLRLMYVYPDRLDRELLKLIKNEKVICKYLDIPLQHISNNVLKAMNRKSTEKSIREKIAEIKKIVPDISLRTNFITGFPGETEKDFQKLLNFIKETEFNYVGIFPYSKEKGTTAFNLKYQIPDKIKRKRVNLLIDAQSAVIDKINGRMINKTARILMDNTAYGRTFQEAPDIDGSFFVTSEKNLKPGSFVQAKIIEAMGYNRKAIV
ncbi:MAG: 30S ribosomal protein S12 methylthiotransferase RimO [Elusimicrobia bacterium]|nr:30S ribosomal protein S12 methylthiotransferase RimO [Elusimicrobiota bacterium]